MDTQWIVVITGLISGGFAYLGTKITHKPTIEKTNAAISDSLFKSYSLENQRMRQENDELRRENQTLRQEFQEMKESVSKELEKFKHDFESERKDFQSQIRSLEIEIGHVTAERDKLKDAYQEVSKDLDIVKNQLASLKLENHELIQDKMNLIDKLNNN